MANIYNICIWISLSFALLTRSRRFLSKLRDDLLSLKMMFQNSNEDTFTVAPSKEEHRRSKYGAYFVMKVLLVVLCVLVVVLLALVAKNFASLKSLNERVKTLENGKSLKQEYRRGGSEQK